MFVHTAVTEGVPQVLMEAAAHSVPIVATDVGGVRQTMGDGAAALLVPPRNLDAFVLRCGISVRTIVCGSR